MREKTVPPATPDEWTPAGVLFAVGVFLVALVALGFALRVPGSTDQRHWLPVVFFLVYGVFTISVGYRGPNGHYYSFDRISQIASLLVLGPVDAALVNGLASLLYPLHRLRRGVPARNVLYASLTNSGIMSLSLLCAGLVYQGIGGQVPLNVITPMGVLALLVLVMSMQMLNHGAMLALDAVEGRGTRGAFAPFSFAIEIGSGCAAVLVAIVYNRLELPVFVLLLAVLGVGMLALRQFAVMRYRLVGIVEERTRSLLEKSLELERLATQDNLTGLFNRRYADAWLTQQLQIEARQSQPITVAMADIDFFKQINDHHSHATGDEVLRRVAHILRNRVRAADMVARYGGEEFLFCFPGTGLREAENLCEELRLAVAGDDWSNLGLTRSVTLSFGLATSRPGASLDTLLRHADSHLYMAKNAGRNRVVA